MRGKWIFLVFFSLSLIFTGIASAGQWAKIYGYGRPAGGDEIAYSIQQTSDGGYIVAGYTKSFGAGSADAWVLKLDASGNVAWQKTYGGTNYDYAYSIQQTSDGGYIVAGWTCSFGGGDCDAWVLKLDANGNVQWQKTYGGSDDDEAYSIQQTLDGGYIVAGYTKSFGAGYHDVWVLKLDSNGNIQWQKTYGGKGIDYANSIQQTLDGGYIVAGYTRSFGLGGDVWVLKLDANGNVQWQKHYGGDWYDYASSIQQTSDGGYIVAGWTQSFGSVGRDDVWVLKLDKDGNIQWQKTYSNPDVDYANSIQQTSDGGYIVAGWTESSLLNYDVWVLKLDANGNIQWQKTYGGSGKDDANSIQQTSDGGYIVAGWTRSFGSVGSNDVWVLKLDSNGNIPGCSVEGSSNATVKTTNVSGVDSSAVVTNTSVTPGTSNAVVKNTSVSPMQICYYESPSSPFTDVPPDYWAINYIKAVKDAGITKGCNPPQNDRFCPEDVVTRAQMAAFIIRAIEGEPTNYSTNQYFSDVPSTHWAFKYIQRVKERNIAQGYAGTNLYGPEDNVTREQMAKMLIMGLVSQGKTSEPPTDYCSTGAPFDDVSPSSWSCRYIKKLKELGITQGCNPPQNNRYCPQNPVTRAQMATFIYRGFLQ